MIGQRFQTRHVCASAQQTPALPATLHLNDLLHGGRNGTCRNAKHIDEHGGRSGAGQLVHAEMLHDKVALFGQRGQDRLAKATLFVVILDDDDTSTALSTVLDDTFLVEGFTVNGSMTRQ